MTTFVLIPGAGGAGHWYWRLVAENLERAGHTARAVDLPGADPSDGSDEIVLVAQSMGAFTALGACDRLAPARLVLLNAMIPAPGETADAWWDDTGWEADRVAAARAGGYTETVDLDTYFLHDVPPAALGAGLDGDHDEADLAFSQPCDFSGWPDVP